MNQLIPEPICKLCGNEFSLVRWNLGYRICMSCAKSEPVQTRTILPMHKSNYLYVTPESFNEFAKTSKP